MMMKLAVVLLFSVVSEIVGFSGAPGSCGDPAVSGGIDCMGVKVFDTQIDFVVKNADGRRIFNWVSGAEHTIEMKNLNPAGDDKATIKGFLMKAVSQNNIESNNFIGEFTTMPAGVAKVTLDGCEEAIGHSGGAGDFNDFTATWTAPVDDGAGDLGTFFFHVVVAYSPVLYSHQLFSLAPPGGNVDLNAVCGDDSRTGLEQCEYGESVRCSTLNSGWNGGVASCFDHNNPDVVANQQDCTWDTSECFFAFCGDGMLLSLANGGSADNYEDCDPSAEGYVVNEERPCTDYPNTNFFKPDTQEYSGGTYKCGADCKWDFSQCEVPPVCGDGIAEQDRGEECEFGETILCSTWDIEFNQGQLEPTGWFTKGSVQCNYQICKWNPYGCVHEYCPDGIVQPEQGEFCDPGIEGGSEIQCVDLPLTHQPPQGGFWSGGVATCSGCDWDTSACEVETCGDNIVDPVAGEQCEGTDLVPCVDLDPSITGGVRFIGGNAACGATCQYDLSQCETCADVYATCLEQEVDNNCADNEDDCFCFNRAMVCAAARNAQCCSEMHGTCVTAFEASYPNDNFRNCPASIACHCEPLGEYGLCPVVLIECPTSWVEANCVARDKNDMCRAPNCPGISEDQMINEFGCRYAYDYNNNGQPDNVGGSYATANGNSRRYAQVYHDYNPNDLYPARDRYNFPNWDGRREYNN